MKTTRRIFLKSGALTVASVGMAPSLGPMFLRAGAFAAEPNRARHKSGGKKILICLFQRGAVDGLSMVVPHGDPYYYKHRTVNSPVANGIAIARTGEGGVFDLDGQFGLHPALAPLLPIYKAGHLAAIQACGSPNATRSHFDAQDYMESAVPGEKTVRDGWLTRALAACPEDRAKTETAFRAVAMTDRLPRSLHGRQEALAIPDLKTFDIGAAIRPGRKGGATNNDGGFEAMYGSAVGKVTRGEGGDIAHSFEDSGGETIDALKIVRGLNAKPYNAANGAQYPRGRFGESLQQIAQIIKADVGLEIAFAEAGGWDTHANQGGAQGTLSRRLQEFAQGLAALNADLGDRMSDVVVLTMSEFGRTVRQNGNGGTDHGHATCFFAMGGDVNGGRVLGDWPGLAPEQLYKGPGEIVGRDLAVTTDFRDVFGELAQKHLGVTNLGAVFPEYQSSPQNFRRVLRA